MFIIQKYITFYERKSGLVKAEKVKWQECEKSDEILSTKNLLRKIYDALWLDKYLKFVVGFSSDMNLCQQKVEVIYCVFDKFTYKCPKLELGPLCLYSCSTSLLLWFILQFIT